MRVVHVSYSHCTVLVKVHPLDPGRSTELQKLNKDSESHSLKSRLLDLSQTPSEF